jgi:hypothetical protein
MPALCAHPDSATHAKTLAVEVDWRWAAPQTLDLEYRILGEVGTLRWPLAAVEPERRDGLWRHSCAELFMAEPGTAGYREFNFSPSGHWAAYEFDGYRHGMRPHAWAGAAPRCALTAAAASARAVVLRVALERAALPAAPGAEAPATGASCASRLAFGPTVVLEALDGSFSFWALGHPPGRPDFHHPDVRCASLEVPS